MTRAQVRLFLALAGVVPLLLALGFAAKVVVMLSHDRDGRGGFADGDYLGAAAEFASNRSLNWFEPWVTSFDEGAARHADGDLTGALALYDRALEDVPRREECTVRINAALAHEALGDAAAEDGDRQEARSQYQAGIDVLADGDCPTDAGRGQEQTDDAAAVDERLREKEQQAESDQQDQNGQQDPPPDDQQGPSPEDEERQRKERRLEERNDDAIDEQQDYEDSRRDRDYSQYHW